MKADIEQDFLIIGTTFDAIAQDAGITQRRTDCGRGRTYQAGYEVFNEAELVELRIKYLEKIVDYFVVIEADITHQGKKKDWNFPTILESKLKLNGVEM